MRVQQTAIGLACAALLAACGGGGGGGGGDNAGEGGMAQSVSFPFPGGETLAIPPTIATIELKATASSGGEIAYVSNTPGTCSVSGSTLSLLKAGECSVNANQAGGNGYAAATARQLFVIPKQPQAIRFRNPGKQPLDGTPVPLAAASSLGLPVVFASSPPAVCSVDGSSLHKLADGLCIVTATADGGEIYETSKLERTIPIGTAAAPELTFSSGYRSATLTNENGKVEQGGGSSLRNWWCDGWCDLRLSADGSTVSNTYSWQQEPPSGGWWHTWAQIDVYAPGVASKSTAGNTAEGMRIDAQSELRFTLGLNQEWFDSTNNQVNVDLVLGHYNRKANNDHCNVTLRATFKPGSAELTNYTIRLKDFAVVDGGCELAELDPWVELQDYPIVLVSFASTEGNVNVPSTTAPAPNYPTTVNLKGKITLQ
ncbi:hypothetical protein OU994_16970 [Pseudoduganella sp. SL102]|uniref:hypothetical protein n=1 Tax=Pseudoduganella sp. SL102 TaxID=2995154 RepID=UPI00248CF906|nr:hypothetical protein [Pseudoduganella sp. SL102]WBS00017.1 hypothetical protein OU994_16970 [Pseudoduganella sp. SL102]